MQQKPKPTSKNQKNSNGKPTKQITQQNPKINNHTPLQNKQTSKQKKKVNWNNNYYSIVYRENKLKPCEFPLPIYHSLHYFTIFSFQQTNSMFLCCLNKTDSAPGIHRGCTYLLLSLELNFLTLPPLQWHVK